MIQQSIDLSEYTTFGVNAIASEFARFDSVERLSTIINSFPNRSLLVLGGGSNLLATKDIDALVLKNEIKGITITEETDNHVIVECGAGEVWHEFVMFCVNNGWGGIENLSLIPGSVGASPMQNIGAYGVEIKDVFHSLDAFCIADGSVKTFSKEACEFGYRESVFKRKLKDQYIILTVRFTLTKHPEVNTKYGAIETQINEMGITSPTIKDVSDAVIAIRSSKLPDPAVLGNAGSFFKNPVVSEEIALSILNQYPDAPVYDTAEKNQKKLAAGWLIEKAGWKGKRIGNCGVHEKQALVLVNFGGATGKEIFELSQRILDDVKQMFGVSLEREVNIL
jgi:UDP-N-acetylmuramate dehydrogenase